MSISLDGNLGVYTSGNVSATGNITADGYFIGNGSQLTGLTANIDLTAVTTNIIPASNVTYSLGNATNQWKDLWISNNTIYINSLPLSTVEVGNVTTIEFNGDPIVTSSNTAPPQTANIATTADIIGGNLVISNATPGGGLVFPDGTVQTTAATGSSYGNANVSTYLASGTDTAGYSTTGNVTAAFFIGDGSQITNLPAGNYSNTNVAAYLAANTDSTILAIDLNLGNTNANLANTDANVANLVTITTNTNANVANLVIITTNTDANVANTNANVANINLTIANLATTSSLANTNANVANLTSALGNTDANVINLDNAIANTNSNVANLTISLANTNANVSNTNANVANVRLDILAGEFALANTDANVANVASNVTTLQGQVYANANVSAYLGNATTTGNIYATNMNVSNTVTATTFIGNFQGNITGNLVVPGANTWVLYNDAGNAGADIGFTYDAATQDVVVGNTVTANFFIGDGSQLTGLPAAYGNANVEAYLPTSNTIIGINGNVNNVIISLNNTNSNVANTDANVATLNNTVANLATTSSLANTNANVANLVIITTNTNSNVANLTSDLANTDANVANLVIITTNTDANVANLTSDLANTDSNVANLQTQVDAIPVVTRIPSVYLTAVANGNGQVFSNVILGNYTSNVDMTAFLNGVLLENTNYTLAGDVLTVDTYLRTGDTIDVTTTLAANVNNVSSGYGNSNVAAFFADFAGDIIPATDNAYDLGEPGNVWAAVYANTFVGDGSQLTGLPNSNTITNGTSNVSIASANANITFNVGGNLVGAISSTSTAFPVRNDTGNVTQAMYYNASTSEVTYGPGLAAFGGFQAPLNNSAITAAMVGDWIQAQGNVTLPDVSTIPAGTVFFITSLASDSTPTTLAVNNTGVDFIYYPPYYSTTTRSITLYRGQWVQIISRGAGEWNIIATNISAPQKISAYLANNVDLSLDIMNFRYDGTNAQFSPTTGSFTVAGQTLQIYPGSAPSSNSFTSGTYTAGTWYNLTGTSLTVAGSTAEAFLYATDSTYRRAYRATFLIVSSGNVYISIERLVG